MKKILKFVKFLLKTIFWTSVIFSLLVLVHTIFYTEELYGNWIVWLLVVVVLFFGRKQILKFGKYIVRAFSIKSTLTILLGIILSTPIALVSAYFSYTAVFSFEPAGIEARNVCYTQVYEGMLYSELEEKFGDRLKKSSHGNLQRGTDLPWPLDESGDGQVYLAFDDLKYRSGGACKIEIKKSAVVDTVMTYPLYN